jgi:hypothetical protein
MLNKIKDRVKNMSDGTKMLIATGSGVGIGAGAMFLLIKYDLKVNRLIITSADHMFMPGKDVQLLETTGKSLIMRSVQNPDKYLKISMSSFDEITELL